MGLIEKLEDKKSFLIQSAAANNEAKLKAAECLKIDLEQYNYNPSDAQNWDLYDKIEIEINKLNEETIKPLLIAFDF